LKQWFAAGEYDKFFSFDMRPEARAYFYEFCRCIFPTIMAIGAPKISIAKLAKSILPILFPTGPKIASRKSAEDCRPSRVETFSLEGVVYFFDFVHDTMPISISITIAISI